MFFTKKKKLNEEIKQALNNSKNNTDQPMEEELPVQSMSEPLPEPRNAIKDLTNTKPLTETHFQQPKLIRESSDSAPLFIKIEKYKEILTSVQEIKLFLSSSKQIFNVFYEIEIVRNDALKILKNTLQRLEKNITEIDVDLFKFKGTETTETEGETEVHHMQSSLSDLHEQLKNLKKDLEEIK